MPSPGLAITLAAAGDTHTPCVQALVSARCDRRSAAGRVVHGAAYRILDTWRLAHLGISAHRGPLYAGPYRIPYR